MLLAVVVECLENVVTVTVKHAVMTRLIIMHCRRHRSLATSSVDDLWRCQAAVRRPVRRRPISRPAFQYQALIRCRCRTCSSTVPMQRASSMIRSTRSGSVWWRRWTSGKLTSTTPRKVGQCISQNWQSAVYCNFHVSCSWVCNLFDSCLCSASSTSYSVPQTRRNLTTKLWLWPAQSYGTVYL